MTNANNESWPGWLVAVAVRVDELMDQAETREHFQRMLRDWKVEHVHRHSAVELLPRRGMSLAEKYAALAAIHDRVCERTKRIDPWTMHKLENISKAKSGTSFTVLCSCVGSLEDADRDRIEGALRDVEKDLARSPTEGDASLMEALPRDDVPTLEKTRTDWRDVQRRLLEMCDNGEPYTTLRDLMQRTGCSSTSTVSKAIKRSRTLKGWQARYTKGTAAPRAGSLTEVVTNNVQQTLETDPSNVLSDDDVDAVIARLIDDAQERGKPAETARLNTMDSEQRRAMAETYYAQKLDEEPSPFEDAPSYKGLQKVRHYKQV